MDKEMTHWAKILDYVLEEGKDLHKWYSTEQGWCYLTDKSGKRHAINSGMTFLHASSIVDIVKEINKNKCLTYSEMK